MGEGVAVMSGHRGPLDAAALFLGFGYGRHRVSALDYWLVTLLRHYIPGLVLSRRVVQAVPWICETNSWWLCLCGDWWVIEVFERLWLVTFEINVTLFCRRFNSLGVLIYLYNGYIWGRYTVLTTHCTVYSISVTVVFSSHNSLHWIQWHWIHYSLCFSRWQTQECDKIYNPFNDLSALILEQNMAA